jgi:PAS domain S-box-containing protein
LLGYTPAEMLGQHAPTLFHHSHASGSPYTAAERAGRQTLLMGRAMSVDDEVFWRKDGSSVAVQYTSVPMVVDGEVQGVVLTFRDTSEEQRIRKALLENEVVMRKAQEIAGFGTYVLDMRTGLWESSPQLDALFGIGPDFVRDVSNWNLLVDDEFRAYAQDHLRLVASGKIDFRLDYRITRPSDGAKRWVAGNGEVEFDAQGAPVRLIGSIQDITNRKRIEAELQEGHDLLHKLSKEIPGVLYQFKMSPDGQFSVPFASKGAVDMFGISHEMVKQDASLIFEVVAAEARTAFIESIRHSAQTLQNWVEEFQVDMPGVGRRWRQGQARPELIEDGSVVWYGFINDITERFESRRQLQQLNENLELHVLERTRELVVALDSAELAKRSRGQFLANVSHEIRTPMNAIMGMVYLLLQNHPSAQQRKYLEKVHQSGVHLLGIINDILDFSKIDAGKLQLDLQSVDLDQFLQQMVHMSEGKANEKGLRLTLDREPAVPRFIRCDALRLGQILINFLNNANKFTEQGHVTLRVAVLQDAAQPEPAASVRLRFAVEDSGMGMNADQLTRLFQPFVQGDNSTTRKFGGTGLGLAISRELAGLMGGEVGALSDVDAGSTFWFACRFELTQAPLAMAATDGAAEHDLAVLRGKRVLVVDDNEFNLDVACDLLTDTGMQVSTAGNGLPALELVHRQHFDIVLMDVQMPVMDGLEATRRIRLDAALASTVVLAMTANAGVEDRNLCLQAGMDEVLTKPIDPDKMFLALARWIGSVRHAPVLPTPLQPAAADELSDCPALPLWDANALQRMVGDRVATRDRLLGSFLQSAGDTVEAIRTAALAGQWSAMAGLAHKLKSSSRAVGAMQLGRLCEALEHAGPDSSCKNLAEMVIRGFADARACIQAR